MSKIWSVPFVLIALLSAGSAHAASETAVEVVLKNPAGEPVGTAHLTPLAKGVRIELKQLKLPPGTHAFHVHENGSCLGPDFKSAGGHYSHGSHSHGFDVAKGPHAGDMPNLIVPESGVLDAEIINTAVTLGDGPGSLRKKGGTALVVHASADDYKSQPAGNAGGRIACGEIK